MPFQAFWKDQERHRMRGTIHSRVMCSNDQRLFDQKVVNVVVMPKQIVSSHIVRPASSSVSYRCCCSPSVRSDEVEGVEVSL